MKSEGKQSRLIMKAAPFEAIPTQALSPVASAILQHFIKIASLQRNYLKERSNRFSEPMKTNPVETGEGFIPRRAFFNPSLIFIHHRLGCIKPHRSSVMMLPSVLGMHWSVNKPKPLLEKPYNSKLGDNKYL